MKYKPLPFYLTIKKSKIHGLGLYSLAKIPKDTTIGMTHIEIGNDLIRTPLGGWINHSEDPNCERKQHNNRLGCIYFSTSKFYIHFISINIVIT